MTVLVPFGRWASRVAGARYAALLIASVTAGPLPAGGQTVSDTVTFEISFPNAVHHEAEITATFGGLTPGQTLELRMSRSSPGRYALHEFAKNVYSVRVTDGAGRELATTRPDPYGWNVSAHDGTVQVTYTLFADLADGTYSGVSREHAHLNIPATFMYARGLRGRPIRVTFRPPEGSGWTVATQLAPTSDPFTYAAPDLDYFMDSPTELGPVRVREWTAMSNGQPSTIRFALHDPSDDGVVDRFVAMVRSVVDEEAAVFGELAPYDFGTYTFVACYGPWASGDGMEHRNSTSITSSRSIEDTGGSQISTVSHEFFHSWNMERIRSAELEPFDYDRADMSDELWFGEGFTQYYTSLILTRAGLLEPDRYVASLAGTINTVVNSPGRRYRSPVEMSRMAPFWDAATSIDPTNLQNTFMSYYTWGSAIGLGLDMTLRGRFGLTLDGFMRAMWVKYGKTEIHYTVDDIRATLAEYTNDAAFASDFFARYVTGRDVPDYEGLLGGVGVLVRKAHPGEASVGLAGLQSRDQGVRVAASYVGTPLYEAGIDDGDVITSLDGVAVTSVDQLQEVVASHAPGDFVPVTFLSGGPTLGAAMRLAEDATLEVLTYEQAGLPVTEKMQLRRADWLSSKVGS